MKIAVLSGKGGTGKTFVSVNLAATAPSALYVDCDVEEPNGHLFLKPKNVATMPVHKALPIFDAAACNGCRRCVDFCRFNALAFIDEAPMVFKDVCHSCGGCLLMCPQQAVREEHVDIGHIETGHHGAIEVASGFLNIGEASGVGIIAKLLEQANASQAAQVVIDCPPGSACSVVESVKDADVCLLVAEPTIFGAHNFEMVAELADVLQKPCGVIINKALDDTACIDTLCAERGLPILARIPYDAHTASHGAAGEIAVEHDPALRQLFEAIWQRLTEEEGTR